METCLSLVYDQFDPCGVWEFIENDCELLEENGSQKSGHVFGRLTQNQNLSLSVSCTISLDFMVCEFTEMLVNPYSLPI